MRARSALSHLDEEMAISDPLLPFRCACNGALSGRADRESNAALYLQSSRRDLPRPTTLLSWRPLVSWHTYSGLAGELRHRGGLFCPPRGFVFKFQIASH